MTNNIIPKSKSISVAELDDFLFTQLAAEDDPDLKKDYSPYKKPEVDFNQIVALTNGMVKEPNDLGNWDKMKNTSEEEFCKFMFWGRGVMLGGLYSRNKEATAEDLGLEHIFYEKLLELGFKDEFIGVANEEGIKFRSLFSIFACILVSSIDWNYRDLDASKMFGKEYPAFPFLSLYLLN